MTLYPVQPDAVALAPPTAASGPPGSDPFASQLAAAAGGAPEDEVRALAAALVSTVFIQPVLSSLRDHSFAAGPFAAGDAERRFGHLLDQNISTRVTEAAQFPLVDVIAERLTKPGPVTGGRVDVRS